MTAEPPPAPSMAPCCPPLLPTLQRQSPPPTQTPPRILLLGPRSAGKSTFLQYLKAGSFDIVPATTGSNVEELLFTPKASFIFTDIPGADHRRAVRLHFLNAGISHVCILFFVPAAAAASTLQSLELEELSYAVSYAQRRSAGAVKLVRVVVSKQDLLRPEEAAGVRRKVREAVGRFRAAGGGGGGDDAVSWDVLDWFISAKTGEGVQEVFEAVAKAVYGDNVPGGAKVLAGGPPPPLPAQVQWRTRLGERVDEAGEELGRLKEKAEGELLKLGERVEEIKALKSGT